MTARPLLAVSLLLLLTGRLPAQVSARTPVLVELFTSEGCSSCPSADALLTRLERDQPVPSADIIVLSEHVDYWDSLGWRDRFSSHQYTERQSAYSSRFHLGDIYTPQMVVAGRAQFVGSDAGAAAKAIVQAAQAKTHRFFLTGLKVDNGLILAYVSLAAGAPGREDPNVSYDIPPHAEFYAALISPHETTAVRAGENGGRTLQHTGVVRSLVRIGDTASWKAALAAGTGLPVSLKDNALPRPLRLVVFAQSAEFGPVLGIVSADLPSRPLQALTQVRK